MDRAAMEENIRWLRGQNHLLATMTVLLVFFILASLVLAGTHNWRQLFPALTVTAGCAVILFLRSRCIKAHYKALPQTEPYILPLSAAYTYDSVLDALSSVFPIEACTNTEDSFVFTTRINRSAYRFFIYRADPFSRKAFNSAKLKSNRIYNDTFIPPDPRGRKYSRGSDQSRINVIVAEEMNEELRSRCRVDAVRSMKGIPSITFTICGDRLYVQPLGGDGGGGVLSYYVEAIGLMDLAFQ